MKNKASESKQVTRAREKLKKRLAIEHEKFTRDALLEMSQKIRSSLVRQHPEPSFLKKKKLTIFDENKHTAQTKSKQILKLEKMLKQSFFKKDSAHQ